MLLLFGASLNAQNNNPVETLDRVYLKNGSVFQGKLVDFEYGKALILELSNGERIEFKDEEVEKVVMEVDTAKVAIPVEEKKGKKKKSNVYAFRESGIYNVTYFANLNGRDDDGLRVGFGAHHVLGYQFNRWIGLGIGLGVDTYSFGDGESLYPVFMEARGYLFKKRMSPYYSMGCGYGFAFANSDEDIDEAEGGLMLHPAIGYRLGASSGGNVVIDVGYKFQSATFTRINDFNDSREVREQYFKRLTLRIGLLF